ncbi:MAG: FecCD family ABC transporter permease [Acidimicrobiia bacterium]
MGATGTGGPRLALALAALGVAAVASLCVGERILGPGQALQALLDGGDDPVAVVVRQARWPRTVIGAAVGAALGVAGVLSQAVTRNPLASPSVLGLVHGAGLAVVALAWAGNPTPGQMAAAAVAGTVVAGAVVLGAAAGRGAPAPARLVLAGIGVTGLCLAAAQMFLVLDESTFEQVRRWITGSLTDRPMDTLAPLWPLMVGGAVVALALGPALDVLATGDDLATGLGQRVRLTRWGAAGAVCALTGAAVAAAGPLVFVGLVVPHAARALGTTDHRAVIVRAAVLGAALVVAADTLARRVVPHHDLPVGVLTAVIGGPAFVVLARRMRR